MICIYKRTINIKESEAAFYNSLKIAIKKICCKVTLEVYKTNVNAVKDI